MISVHSNSELERRAGVKVSSWQELMRTTIVGDEVTFHGHTWTRVPDGLVRRRLKRTFRTKHTARREAAPISAMLKTPHGLWRAPRNGRITRSLRGYKVVINGVEGGDGAEFCVDDVLEFVPWLVLPGSPPLYVEWM